VVTTAKRTAAARTVLEKDEPMPEAKLKRFVCAMGKSA
jgi:hypothetical protein